MRSYGIDPDTDLAEIVDAGSHDAVVSGVYDGSCDAGSTYVDARSNLEEQYPDVMDVVKVVEVSADIPNDGVQFSPTVPAEIREPIVQALIAMGDSEEGVAALDQAYEWTKLVPKDDSFYDPFRQVLDAAGVDPATLIGN
jgi:phosphonate transport system substrate-binding protein